LSAEEFDESDSATLEGTSITISDGKLVWA